MVGISLVQPLASLVCGVLPPSVKRRRWVGLRFGSDMAGQTVAIVSSLSEGLVSWHKVGDSQFDRRSGLPRSLLPFGCVMGSVRVVEVVPRGSERWASAEMSWLRSAATNSSYADFCWIIDDVRLLENPRDFPYPSRPMLFNMAQKISSILESLPSSGIPI